MRVTIITPCLNCEKTIHDTLASVARQDYPDIEHIVIDGQSTDRTLDIVRQFPHVAKLISEKDRGIYDAMNKGLIAATGDVIAVLNADDFYVYDRVISDVINLMRAENANVVYADLDYVARENTRKVTRVWFSGPYNRDNFKRGWSPPHPTFFARKSLYERFGGFNTSMQYSADYELMLRFLYINRQPCAYLPKTIVKMRRGGVSNISIRNRIAANIEDRRSWQYNKLSTPFWVPILKPLRKLPQFFPGFVGIFAGRQARNTHPQPAPAPVYQTVPGIPLPISKPSTKTFPLSPP